MDVGTCETLLKINSFIDAMMKIERVFLGIVMSDNYKERIFVLSNIRVEV